MKRASGGGGGGGGGGARFHPSSFSLPSWQVATKIAHSKTSAKERGKGEDEAVCIAAGKEGVAAVPIVHEVRREGGRKA